MEKQQKIGDRVKMLRQHLGLNQVKFAESIGKEHSSISGYENAHKTPSVTTIHKICEVHKVQKSWLVEGVGSAFISDDGSLTMGFGPDHGKVIPRERILEEENKSLKQQVREMADQINQLINTVGRLSQQLGKLKALNLPYLVPVIEMNTEVKKDSVHVIEMYTKELGALKVA